MLNKNYKFKFFVDFDGTITKEDIGEQMFLEFGDPAECRSIIQEWLDDKINSQESWIRLCDTIKNFDEKRFDNFLNKMEIDETFIGFLNFCKINNYEVAVLSDGFDLYIDKISVKENFSYLNIFCNNLSVDNDNKLNPGFPYTDEECGKCGNCKRNHIISLSSDDDITFYIGDGWSDKCPAQYCDFIFAKKSLLKYCEDNRISYFPFKDFNDVIKIVNGINKKKNIKKRHQAMLKRKDAYMQG